MDINNIIENAFGKPRPKFLKPNQDNSISLNSQQTLNGEEITRLSSSGCLYLTVCETKILVIHKIHK